MKNLAVLAATAAAVAFAAPSSAALYHFVLTSAPGDTNESADFYLDSSPTPDVSIPDLGFGIYDVPGSYAYGTDTATIENLYFYNGDANSYYGNTGGFLTGDFIISSAGPQLYTGSEDAPTFLTGTFALTDFLTGQALSLTISGATTPAVPEPASWAMLITGFGLMGSAMRRRRASVSFA